MSAVLVRGGYLYPGDEEASVWPDGSVLVEGTRIVAAGPTAQVEEVLRSRRSEVTVIDARGKMILPGFVNPHWHEMFALRLPFKAALRPPRDRDDRPAFMALGGDVQQVSTLFDSFYDQIGGLTAAEAHAIARYSLWTQLRTGVTTVGDVGSYNRPQALAAAARELGMRCVVSTWASDGVCAHGESRFRRTRDTDVVLSGIEGVLQDAAADRTGLIRARPTAVYATNMSDELCQGFAELSARYDVPFATHVGALRHEPQVTQAYFGSTPIRRLEEHGLLSSRLMAVHCAFADEQEQKLLVAADAHINHSPAKYGPAGEASLTETRAMPEFRRHGLDVSLSTDGASLPLGGMAEAMRVVWQLYNEMYADPTEVLPTDALAMATRLAARGLGWAEDIGSLTPGRQADLLLVPTDDWRYLLNPRPLESFLTLGGSADVDTVMVAGQVVLDGGHATAVQEQQLQTAYLQALESFSVRCLRLDPDTVTALTRPAARPAAPAATGAGAAR